MAPLAFISPHPREELPTFEVTDKAGSSPVIEDTEVRVLGLPVGLPHTFLSLAPTTSASYPVPRKLFPVTEASRVWTEVREINATTASIATPEVIGHDMLNARRSSSMSSEASAGASPSQRKRFLRLGPVHQGEHIDENGDWSEEVIIG
jgi:hypothetical protein